MLLSKDVPRPNKDIRAERIMSALPPKADMCSALANVCFGPEADIALLDHLVSAGE
jgi:hypothetical protein